LDRKLTRHRPQVSGPILGSPPILASSQHQERDGFFAFITQGRLINEQQPSETLRDAINWYEDFLRAKFNSAWTTLLRPTLEGLNGNSPLLQRCDDPIIYRFMTRVAQQLSEKKDVALTDFVDELSNEEGLLKEPDEDRSLPFQLVFAAIGWLSMFS
jgi:hypothetical protein